jgi:hypothetical protein
MLKKTGFALQKSIERTKPIMAIYSISERKGRPYLLIALLGASLAVFSSACQKPSISFGSAFVSNNNTNIIVIDTCNVQLSTLLQDSFPTAGTGAMLLGHYQDPYFGTITSRTFAQIGNPVGANISTIPGVALDSICLIMFLNKWFYGDTIIPQRYYVSQLDTVITYPFPTQRTFYNNSSFPYNPTPWGYTDVSISPTANFSSQQALDSVKIRLPDSLGQTLIRMIQNHSDTVTNLNTFLSYFKGIVVYSDSSAGNSGAMFGFKDTVLMRLYYQVPGVYTTLYHFDFRLYNKFYQFNQITADRTGTPLAILNTLQASRPNPLIPTQAPSNLTNNAVYVQGASGIQTKITFPSLLNIASLPDYLGISRALLILKPLPGTFNQELPLPPQLVLSQSNETNVLGPPITSGSGTQFGSLIVDYTYGVNTSYTYDITSYIQGQMTVGGITQAQDALILNVPFPANGSTTDRVVFGDNTNKNYTISLRLYYVSLIQ